MKKLTLEDKKKVSLDILLNIHEFCTSNGISYSIGYGTMLGAVRHKGFIPWDDDVDILMMRDDYERFISIYNNDRYFVIDHNCEKDYILTYAKVVDSKTIEKNEWMPKIKMGIGVDIFPVDYIGDSMTEVINLFKKKNFWGNLFILKVLNCGWRGIFKTTFLLFSKLLLLPVSQAFLCEKVQSFANINEKKKSGFWGVITPQSEYNGVMEYDVFSNISDIEFEGHKLKCISNTDEYLRKTYGDYLKLPPIEKRVSTHESEVFYAES